MIKLQFEPARIRWCHVKLLLWFGAAEKTRQTNVALNSERRGPAQRDCVLMRQVYIVMHV